MLHSIVFKERIWIYSIDKEIVLDRVVVNWKVFPHLYSKKLFPSVTKEKKQSLSLSTFGIVRFVKIFIVLATITLQPSYSEAADCEWSLISRVLRLSCLLPAILFFAQIWDNLQSRGVTSTFPKELHHFIVIFISASAWEDENLRTSSKAKSGASIISIFFVFDVNHLTSLFPCD